MFRSTSSFLSIVIKSTGLRVLSAAIIFISACSHTMAQTPANACTGPISFSEAPDVPVGTNSQSVTLGDFNRDGKVDFAAANFNSNDVSIRLGDGAGGFISPATPEVAVGTGPRSVIIGDFNNDGKQDFVTANGNSNNVSIRLGDGTGGFTVPSASGMSEVAVGNIPGSVAIGYFDGDGNQDLVVANVGGDTISVRLGNGFGGFTSPTTSEIAVGSAPISVAVGDVNGDGLWDFASANLSSNNVSIRLGDGAGGFTSPPTPEVVVGNSPASIVIGEFDGNGEPDIATANTGSADVSIRLGDGAGGFTPPSAPGETEVAVGANPRSIRISDFDRDGKQDLAVANVAYATVSIRIGNGSGGFTAPAVPGMPEVSVGTNPIALAASDFNSDGRPDFLVATEVGPVSVRLTDCLDAGPTPTPTPLDTFSIDDVAGIEGNSGGYGTAVMFTVTRTGLATEEATVAFQTINGTAIAQGDYSGTSGTIVFSAGETTETIFVAIYGDTNFENNEEFTVQLFNVIGATISDSDGIATILNDDAAPTPTPAPNPTPLPIISISVTPSVVSEDGAANLTYTFTRSVADGGLTINVSITGTAGFPSDVSIIASGSNAMLGPNAGTVTFLPGSTTAVLIVDPISDTLPEANETFIFTITDGSGYSVGTPSSATGTILNDDVAQPSISINDVTLLEGNAGTAALTFSLTRSGPTATASSVSFTTLNGSAVGGVVASTGVDYNSISGVFTFAPGQTTGTISVVVFGDTIFEPNETFFIHLTNPSGATLHDAIGLGTIFNDDAPLPSFSIGDVTQAEGNAGATVFTFTVTKSGPDGPLPPSVSYTTMIGTATAGSDYVSASGVLSFVPGQSVATISVIVNGDTLFENNEEFFVQLSNPIGATIFDAIGMGTILNDDALPLPSLSITSVTALEGNAGSTVLNFLVTKSVPLGSATVSYATVNGNAIGGVVAGGGVDYNSASGTLTFAPGQTTAIIPVVVFGDTLFEGDENFTVSLFLPVGATISNSTGVGTILNDDPANASFTPTGSDVTTQAPSGAAGVTFSSVTTAGTTEFTPVSPGSVGGAVPSGFTIMEGGPAFDISTTAAYTAPLTVCLVVSVPTAEQFALVRILHGEGAQLVDRTILTPETPAPDFATGRVCARVDSLSPFVVALAPVPLYKVTALFDQTISHNSGSSVPIKLKITDTNGVNQSSSAIVLTALRVDAGNLPAQSAGNSNPSNAFTFDASSRSYKYNLKTQKTWAAGTYRLVFSVAGDPVEYSVEFTIR